MRKEWLKCSIIKKKEILKHLFFWRTKQLDRKTDVTGGKKLGVKYPSWKKIL